MNEALLITALAFACVLLRPCRLFRRPVPVSLGLEEERPPKAEVVEESDSRLDDLRDYRRRLDYMSAAVDVETQRWDRRQGFGRRQVDGC